MATHSNVLAWRIPWTEEPDGLQSTESQRVRHVLVTKQQTTRLTDEKNETKEVKPLIQGSQLENQSLNHLNFSPEMLPVQYAANCPNNVSKFQELLHMLLNENR